MKMTKQQAIETLKSLLLNIAGEKDCEAIEFAIAALQSDPDAPDWSQAPEWANYYAIDDDGQCFWYENEPVRRGNDFYPSSGRDQLHIKKKSTTLFKRPDQ